MFALKYGVEFIHLFWPSNKITIKNYSTRDRQKYEVSWKDQRWNCGKRYIKPIKIKKSSALIIVHILAYLFLNDKEQNHRQMYEWKKVRRQSQNFELQYIK